MALFADDTGAFLDEFLDLKKPTLLRKIEVQNGSEAIQNRNYFNPQSCHQSKLVEEESSRGFSQCM